MSIELTRTTDHGGLRIDELGLTTPHLVHAARLDWEHGDPWHRILLAQATLEDMDLISVDKVFDELTDRRMW